MSSCSIQVRADIGPVSIRSSLVRSAEAQFGMELDLPAAVPGTITGTGATLAADHGLTEGNAITIYWPSGRRYGLTIDSVDGQQITFSGGKGDALPAEGTDVLVSKERGTVFGFAGHQLTLLLMSCPARSCVRFLSSEGTLMVGADLAAGEPWTWWDNQVDENPFGRGLVGIIVASQAGPTMQAVKMGLVLQGG
jgi:hypothetical protein